MSKFRVVLINAKEFQKWLDKLSLGVVEQVIDDYLNKECERMVVEMKNQMGIYQGSRGPFPAWPALKPETIAQKKNGDTPLLEEGDLQASIGFESVSPLKKLIGATDRKAAWHEYGAPEANLPARPFVRPIIWQNTEILKMGIRKALVKELRERSTR